jgi:hypothetical protein
MDYCIDWSHIAKFASLEITIMKRSTDSEGSQDSGNGMEVEGLKTMIPRWKRNSHVRAYRHDNHAKAQKAIFDASWIITEFIDPNDLMKSDDRKCKKMDTKSYINGVGIGVQKWFENLVSGDHDMEERPLLRLNSA